MKKALTLLLCLLLGLMASLPAALAEEETRYAEVATPKGTLNLRASAKDSAKVLKRLAKGSIVEVLQEEGDWTQVRFGKTEGFVKASFLKVIDALPYTPITSDQKGDHVMAFKRAMHGLGYLRSDDVNQRFDPAMESALLKLQLLNDLPLTPGVVTAQAQALMAWEMLAKAKTGYVDLATDDASGLTVAIFCWDSDGTLYDDDKAVKLKISYGAQATGGTPPYDITVRKSISASGGDVSGDLVQSPFSHIWGQTSDTLYVYATAVDADGNTVTACAPFRYTLPDRYR